MIEEKKNIRKLIITIIIIMILSAISVVAFLNLIGINIYIPGVSMFSISCEYKNNQIISMPENKPNILIDSKGYLSLYGGTDTQYKLSVIDRIKLYHFIKKQTELFEENKVVVDPDIATLCENNDETSYEENSHEEIEVCLILFHDIYSKKVYLRNEDNLSWSKDIYLYLADLFLKYSGYRLFGNTL